MTVYCKTTGCDRDAERAAKSGRITDATHRQRRVGPVVGNGHRPLGEVALCGHVSKCGVAADADVRVVGTVAVPEAADGITLRWWHRC